MNLRSKLLAVAILTGVVIYGPSFEVQSHLSLFGDDSDLILSEKKLSLNASTLTSLRAETGAGKLEIQGIEGLNEIELVASIYAYDDSKVELSLDSHSQRAELIAKIQHSGMSNESPYIDLVLNVPAMMMLDIKDGSGSIKINDVMADIELVDGSGSIQIEGGKKLAITDGSGSITIKDTTGALALTDGSGSINLENIGGNVAIDDGSGSINVKQVQGLVVINDGSGSINVTHAQGLTVKNAGSGSVNYSDISGSVNL
jgi:hypothetical protein